jgi:hypothetical protein
MSPTELGSENDCSDKDQKQLYKVQTSPLVIKGASHQQTHNCLSVITIWSWAPDGYLTPRQTGRLMVGHDIILTMTLTMTSGVLVSELENCFSSNLSCCCEKLLAEVRDSSRNRTKGNVRRWKHLPSNG